MPRGAMLRVLLMRHAFWWMFALGIAVVGVMSLGVFEDLRFLVVALMLVCLVVPMTAAMLYIFYGMAPATTLNMTLHKVKFTSEEICVEILERDEKNSDLVPVRNVAINYDDVKGYALWGAGIVLLVKGRDGGELYIPYSSFWDVRDFKDVVKLISQ